MPCAVLHSATLLPCPSMPCSLATYRPSSSRRLRADWMRARGHPTCAGRPHRCSPTAESYTATVTLRSLRHEVRAVIEGGSRGLTSSKQCMHCRWLECALARPWGLCACAVELVQALSLTALVLPSSQSAHTWPHSISVFPPPRYSEAFRGHGPLLHTAPVSGDSRDLADPIICTPPIACCHMPMYKPY